ncbi:hypothetical protein GALMADRAFT_209010 [Galerina marginata CBS 339.88]|uniref:Ubiquitin-like protease family profile domain-containing protein n=1 Tax=Galerina marginata (strain CBS 339.88) TaxID=685588 RepID=A0A067T5Y0_GALM3|nr:hypothetical protein GALMADRAFT_209010 [Galerina marginata CBS 339.88]
MATTRRIHDIQQKWTKAIQWVDKYRRKEPKGLEDLMKHAEGPLNKHRWDEFTEIPGADGYQTSTFKFASYLSDNKVMGTDHINMMFVHLSERAEEDPTTDEYVIIEQLRFMKAVEKVACAKKNENSERWLGRLEDKSEIETYTLLFFLYTWKKKSIGDQDNFTDCGILAANIAAHDIFADKPWNPETKARHRVEWSIIPKRVHAVEMLDRQSQPRSLSHPVDPAPDSASVQALENVVPMDVDHVEGLPPYITNSHTPMDIDLSHGYPSSNMPIMLTKKAPPNQVPEESRTQRKASSDRKNKKKRTNSGAVNEEALPRKVPKPDRDAGLREAMSFRRSLPL